MSIAQDIMSTPDRTQKERRDMAEIRDIGKNGSIDWNGDCITYYFNDDSSLTMTLDEKLEPTEFLVIHSQEYEEALIYAKDAISVCKSNSFSIDKDTISHNIESNFPNLSRFECDLIANQAIIYESGK